MLVRRSGERWGMPKILSIHEPAIAAAASDETRVHAMSMTSVPPGGRIVGPVPEDLGIAASLVGRVLKVVHVEPVVC